MLANPRARWCQQVLPELHPEMISALGVQAGGHAEQQLSGHTDSVACLAFSSDGSKLASGGLDGKHIPVCLASLTISSRWSFIDLIEVRLDGLKFKSNAQWMGIVHIERPMDVYLRK